ncbi:MAG: amino acid transporter [Rhodobiaceae bacterium]|nr:amino acid transporter [Rhodobiaceae bacterium]
MEPGLFTPVFTGLLVGLGLIVAIGAQNAFVLRQGLLREHVVPVILVCALSDLILIAAGVLGLGTLISQSPVLIRIATWGGAGFLLVYAGLALRRAMAPESLRPAANEGNSLRAVVVAALLFTWLNPHVYLDTVVLFGSLSASYDGAGRVAFWCGGSLASIAWFSLLGGGARFLAPLFSRPVSWRILDLAIAAVMVAIAISLLWGAAA